MKLSLLFFSNAVFTSTILATPYSWGRQSSARFHSPTSLDTKDTEYTTNWAGAILKPLAGQPYSEIESQFTIPALTPPTLNDGNWATAVWVGIDGSASRSAIFQSGVMLELSQRRGVARTRFTAWYQWLPAPAVFLRNDFSINIGDEIYIQITGTSPTTGDVTINNLNSGTKQTYSVSAPSNQSIITGLEAEWILESIKGNGYRYPLPNFDTFTFSVCRATAGGLPVNAQGANLCDIEGSSGTILTNSSIPDDNTVQIKYLASQ